MAGKRKGGRPKKELEKHLLATLTEREQQAYQLKLAGYSYPKIGQALGVSGKTAWYDVKRVTDLLEKHAAEKAHAQRNVWNDRLEAAVRAIFPQVLAGDLDAVRTLCVIFDRASALWAFNKPVKVDIAGRVREIAEANGLDPDEAVAKAEEVVRQYQRLRG